MAIASGYIYAPTSTTSWATAFTLPTEAKPKVLTTFYAGIGSGSLSIGGSLNYMFGNAIGYGYFNFTYSIA